MEDVKTLRLNFSASTAVCFDQGFFLDWEGPKREDDDDVIQRTDFSRPPKAPRSVWFVGCRSNYH